MTPGEIVVSVFLALFGVVVAQNNSAIANLAERVQSIEESLRKGV